jgi:hypothetical protein
MVTSAAASTVYLYFDGDDVGSGIELCLLRGDINGAALVSVRVRDAIVALTDSLQAQFGARIVFAGGDEVLALTTVPVTTDGLATLRDEFRYLSGLSISCGWATSARDATLNLRIAKLRGKDQVQGPVDD